MCAATEEDESEMDVKRFFGVLRRHKLLVIGGLILAVGVAAASYKELAKPLYEAEAQLLITQGNDPYGDAAQATTTNASSGVTYMSSLAPIYAAIANGDVVQGELRKAAPGDTVIATDAADPVSGANLPIVQFTVSDPSPAGAHKVAALAATILENYVATQQAAGHVPSAQRVQFSAVQDGGQPKLLSGPSKTTSGLLFVVILACMIGLAFKLDKRAKSGEDDAAGSGEGEVLGGPWPTDADGAHTVAPDRVRSAPGVSSV